MTPAQAIIAAVCEVHGVEVRDIMQPGSRRHIVHARNEALHELRVVRGWTYRAIGKLFGMDHTSVIYGIATHRRINGIE